MPDETPEEKARRLGVPLIPKRPVLPMKVIAAVCGECGREVPHMDMYACPRENCPLKTHTTCST